MLKLIRVEAPNFDGSHQPSEYLDWEASMDQYFDWYPMVEERKVRLAKMRLTKLAKTYWLNVESLRGVRRQEPIDTWEDMKAQLRSKYLPPSYHQTLFDEWQSLTQEGKSVAEYIKKFNHYLLKCRV